MTVQTVLAPAVLDGIDAALADTDAHLTRAYPGEDGRRQPVHTVYVPADRYTADLPRRWGHEALSLVEKHGGWSALGDRLGLDRALVDEVTPRVAAKLATEPIEDLRLDFEDGYGNRDDRTEDAEAVRTASELAGAIASGQAPDFVGLRFKCLEAPTRRRGVRTLDLFLGTLLSEGGGLPDGLVITLPKVSTATQVAAMVTVCSELETAYGLPAGRLGFEIQVETPQLILGADGTAPVAAALHAGGGRVTALHYGTYDYSASLQIAAAHQSAAHPAADHAKAVMQVAVAGTAVQLSDGSTNVLPIGPPEQVHQAWLIHAGLVRRALERGYYQGWDLHPGQLPTRFLMNFAFYRQAFAASARRLADYVHRRSSGVLDEPATARALARFLHRGLTCGATEETELVSATGLGGATLEALARPKSDTEMRS